ncbi:MAG: tRNA lysidine(34) synthetase TilS [Gammaproteobacteria bacterium]|nr:tRNA lysidine(34) synthetase TilS [Gammaproteobacteria bacterium]
MLNLSLKFLPFFPRIKRIIIAYSGGLDSHVLLHVIAAMRAGPIGCECIALHINHGLSEKAGQWAAHCARQCEALNIPFANINVDAKSNAGESPEAVARAVRYQAFREFMQPGDCLLTAHHQDDQAETLLIQLLRGAGPRGLAAMPGYSDFAEGWHARPLLNFSRDELHEYAQQIVVQNKQSSWIEDGSNSDTRFDRNFLRHEIMPKLKSRFPGMATTLSRSASLCAEAAGLLVSVAADDLQQAAGNDGVFSVTGLRALGEVRARNLLHQCCRDRGLPTPSAAQLQCVWNEVIGASEDREPVVSWAGGEVRRYRDALFIDVPLSPHDATLSFSWNGQEMLSIPGLGRLHGESVTGQGIALWALEGQPLAIRFRRGGEKLRPVGRTGHHALKKLFQEAGIPPWLRERIPLLYADGQLLAVAGQWVAHEAATQPGEEGVCLRWLPSG